MLTSGLVESIETKEAITKIIEHCYTNNQGLGEIEDSDWDNLVQYGFLDILKSKYFNPDFTSNNARTLGKEKYNFFYGYIFKLMKKKEWVGIIVSIFSRPDYPTVWSNIFVENYLSSSENKAYFEEVCKEYALDIPECLK